MIARARVVAVCVGVVAPLPHEPSVRTGYLKPRAPGPVRVTHEGLVGDGQASRTVHGGPERAVLAYAAAHYAAFRAELGDATPAFGGFGENLTIDGLDERTTCVGDRFAVGANVLLEVSLPRKPCGMISRATRIETLFERVEATGRIGWLHRVIAEGDVAEGDAVTLVARPHPDWTVARAADVMERMRGEGAEAIADARALAAVKHLSDEWRDKLRERLDAASRRETPP